MIYSWSYCKNYRKIKRGTEKRVTNNEKCIWKFLNLWETWEVWKEGFLRAYSTDLSDNNISEGLLVNEEKVLTLS